MPELFNPALPGVSRDLDPGWGRSGWLEWGALSDDEQTAHEAAVAAAKKAAEAAQNPAPPDLGDASEEHESESAAAGDVPKE